jgi:hypothetical protein
MFSLLFSFAILLKKKGIINRPISLTNQRSIDYDFFKQLKGKAWERISHRKFLKLTWSWGV